MGAQRLCQRQVGAQRLCQRQVGALRLEVPQADIDGGDRQAASADLGACLDEFLPDSADAVGALASQ
jgi:hypothetical protein